MQDIPIRNVPSIVQIQPVSIQSFRLEFLNFSRPSLCPFYAPFMPLPHCIACPPTCTSCPSFFHYHHHHHASHHFPPDGAGQSAHSPKSRISTAICALLAASATRQKDSVAGSSSRLLSDRPRAGGKGFCWCGWGSGCCNGC